MGVVYRGLDPHLGRYVAIKVMSQGIATDKELRDRFMREARAAGSLQHPNIITIYDFGEAEGSLYIAMEYVEGSDLSQIIDRRDPLPLTGKIDIMVDVLHALDYAHHRGVVHRDVKPANIRVSVDGRAKLMDFGIARLEKSDLTKSGIMIGTPDYMAPEQVTGGPITPVTDVFAVGAVLYEFLTNQRSFHGETIHEVLYKVVSEQPPPLRDVAKGIPGSLQPILDKALAKDPAQRYASAGLFARELAAVRTALGGAVTVAVQSRTTPLKMSRLTARPGSARKGWRRTAVWAGAGAGVLALAAAAALVLGGRVAGRATPAATEPGRVAAPPSRVVDSATVAATSAPPTAAPRPESAAAPSPAPKPPEPSVPHLGGARTALANFGRRHDAARAGDAAPAAQPLTQAASPPATAVPSVTNPAAPAPGAAAPEQPIQGPPQAAPAAAAQPAPVQPAPSPPPAEPEDPRPQIEALISAYARAIESRSVTEIRGVYPSLTSDQQRDWEQFFRATRSVRARLAVAGLDVRTGTADIAVSGGLDFDAGSGTQHQPMSFRATAALENGTWRLRSVHQ